MADVTLTYKGATIGELSESGNKTIKTAGKYCEADVLLEYTKPSASGIITVSPLVTITAQSANRVTGSVNSLKDAVIAEIGDVPFIARHISGVMEQYNLAQLLYIPASYFADNNGWLVQTVRVDYPSNPVSNVWFNQHLLVRETTIQNNYTYTISANSVYAVVKTESLYSEIKPT